MTDINNSIALEFRPVSTGSTDIVGSLSAFAQMQEAQALSQQARANAGLIQAGAQYKQGLNEAYQRTQSLLQNGMSAPDAFTSGGLAFYPGANDTTTALTAAQTLKGIQGYAANPSDPNSAAAGGPALVGTAIANQQAAAGVQSTQLANTTTQAQLHGQLGTMMANDPSPQGRAEAAAFARTIPLAPGETPAMREAQIQAFVNLSPQQYVLAGQHFIQASMTPDQYYVDSGTARFNQGNAAAATYIGPLRPTDYLAAGDAAKQAYTSGGGFAPIMPGQQGVPAQSPATTPTTTPTAAPGPPAATPAPVSPQPTAAPGIGGVTDIATPAQMASPGGGFGPSDMTSSPLYNQAGQAYGVSPSDLARVAQIESSGNPNAINWTSNAAGLFQFVPSTWRQYGQGSPFDAVASTDAAARLAADNQATLTQAIGRPPTPAELYLAHQQGVTGAAKPILNPNVPAGQLVGAKAIAQNGGNPNAPASAFVSMWAGKFGGPVSPTAFGGGQSAVLPASVSGAPAPGVPISPLAIGAAPQLPPPPSPFGTAVQTPGLVAPQGAAALAPPVVPGAPAAKAGVVAGAPSAAAAPPPISSASPAGPLNPNALLPGDTGTAPAAAATSVGSSPSSPIAPNPFAPRYTPATLAEQGVVGTNLGNLQQKYADEADAAQQQNTTIDQMLAASQSWRQGKWSDVEQTARESLQALAQMSGVKAPGLDQPTADYQEFVKLAGQVSRAAAADVSSQTGVEELRLINKSLPIPELTAQGMQQVAATYQGVNDYKIARQQALAKWVARGGQGNGSAAGFQADWNKNVSPSAFWVNRMPPDELQLMASNMAKTPEGRATLGKLMGEVKWANDNGLLGP